MRRDVLRSLLAASVAGTAAACGYPDRSPPAPPTPTPSADDPGSPSVPATQRLTYGEDPSQFGVLHAPSGTSRGVVVVVHGGFWLESYDLSLGAPLAADLASRGWTAWNLEYRRVDGGPGGAGGVPETLDDVAAGIDRLAEVDGLDLSTVVTLGHSAGGQLGTWAAARSAPASRRWQPVRVPVTHVVAQAGVLDLRRAGELGLGTGAVEAFLGYPAADVGADVDPLQQVPLDQPVWCVHGDADANVPFSQSEAYVAAATAAGGQARLVEVPGDHRTLIDVRSEAWSRTVAVLDGIAPPRG